ncbi:hypothetical protein ASG49_13670 [Marmoricola sp. Leaf446]|uniref:hypothetical protein n=1 Tax=Marmoricola sp. Leaf446 TaxID=1736379 RepID=UPI0006F2EA25|nr:hypothetical protein [Marmoricola sp. Leaf446]KQT90786.1 hypothetical protein ASG49_13670 [Marmoricola sp. Leaf446]
MTRRSRRPRPARDDNHGLVREPRIADLMKPDHERFVESSRAAERAGDAATALEFHVGVPMFTRGAHTVMLRQLAGLSADEMTPWLWARWAAYQCTRAEETTHELGLVVRSAVQVVLDVFYAERLAEAHATGRDWMPVVAGVLGDSWLFHQLCAYELEGLSGFLEVLATDELLEHSDLARAWSDATMGGYRLDAADGLVVEDLASGEERRLLDLGAGVAAGVGDSIGSPTEPTPRWVIGRLVPSGTDPAWMFDTRPVAVDEQTAREVAAGENVEWLGAVHRAVRAGRVRPEDFEPEDRELVTDVPSLSLVHLATPRQALPATLDKLARGSDEVGRAAYKILRGVAEGRTDPRITPPVVAAAVLQPHAWDEAQRSLTCHPDTWRAWATLVPEPARSRLQHLAEVDRLREAG